MYMFVQTTLVCEEDIRTSSHSINDIFQIRMTKNRSNVLSIRLRSFKYMIIYP